MASRNDLAAQEWARMIPYIDFSELLIGGVLTPGQRTGSKSVDFSAPGNAAFTVLAKLPSV